jgi:hypothetical protein
MGAGLATVVGEALSLAMAANYCSRHITLLRRRAVLSQPAIAAIAMSVAFLLTQSLLWPAQALIAVVVYFAVLFLLGNAEVCSWAKSFKIQASLGFRLPQARYLNGVKVKRSRSQ